MAATLEDVRANSAPEPYITSAELKEALSVSDSTLKAWRARGMPFIGGGMTRPRYRLSDVVAWLGASR